jgi:hypothetical protein
MASTPQTLWGLFLKILGLAAAIGVLILVVCPEPSSRIINAFQN